jgi:hypothetical protein
MDRVGQHGGRPDREGGLGPRAHCADRPWGHSLERRGGQAGRWGGELQPVALLVPDGGPNPPNASSKCLGACEEAAWRRGSPAASRARLQCESDQAPRDQGPPAPSPARRICRGETRCDRARPLDGRSPELRWTSRSESSKRGRAMADRDRGRQGDRDFPRRRGPENPTRFPDTPEEGPRPRGSDSTSRNPGDDAYADARRPRDAPVRG